MTADQLIESLPADDDRTKRMKTILHFELERYRLDVGIPMDATIEKAFVAGLMRAASRWEVEP